MGGRNPEYPRRWVLLYMYKAVARTRDCESRLHESMQQSELDLSLQGQHQIQEPVETAASAQAADRRPCGEQPRRCWAERPAGRPIELLIEDVHPARKDARLTEVQQGSLNMPKQLGFPTALAC